MFHILYFEISWNLLLYPLKTKTNACWPWFEKNKNNATSQNCWGYLKNHWTNTRLVCTHFNAFFLLNPNMIIKFEFDIFKFWKHFYPVVCIQKWKGLLLWPCDLQSISNIVTDHDLDEIQASFKTGLGICEKHFHRRKTPEVCTGNVRNSSLQYLLYGHSVQSL